MEGKGCLPDRQTRQPCGQRSRRRPLRSPRQAARPAGCLPPVCRKPGRGSAAADSPMDRPAPPPSPSCWAPLAPEALAKEALAKEAPAKEALAQEALAKRLQQAPPPASGAAPARARRRPGGRPPPPGPLCSSAARPAGCARPRPGRTTAGPSSRWRESCHSADAPSPSLLHTPTKRERVVQQSDRTLVRRPQAPRPAGRQEREQLLARRAGAATANPPTVATSAHVCNHRLTPVVMAPITSGCSPTGRSSTPCCCSTRWRAPGCGRSCGRPW